MAGQAPRSVARDVEDIETITTGLTRAILGDNAVNTNLAVATPGRTDDIDTITNRLGEAILGEDENQRLATLPAEEGKAVGGEDQGAKLDEARSAEDGTPEKPSRPKAEEEEDEVNSAENHTPEKASRPKPEEGEDAINALGAACSSWSIEDDEEAEARRESQRLKEQIRVTHEEKMRTLDAAEAKRRSDEECNAFERKLQADIDKARLHEMKRKARKEKDEEAARQLRAAAEAETNAIAERRARQERQAHEEALELEAKREADNKAQLALLEAYNNIFHNTAIAEANARQEQIQRQREAELIAQYHEVLAQQAQLAELQRRQQEEQFLQQHYAHPSNWQVPESAEEMDTAPEAEVCEATEKDTEMEASGGAEMEWELGGEMEWELEEEKSRLRTYPLPPSSPPAPESSAPAQGLPSSDTSLATAKDTGNKAKAENSSPRSPSQSATMAPTVVTATPEPAARAPLHLPPLREASKARRIDTKSQASAASPASPQAAEQAATPQPSLAPAPSPAAVPPPAPALASQSPAAEAAPAAPAPASAPPPMPARPAPSNQRTLTIVCGKSPVIHPTLAAIRPIVNACSPLGRLLSQHKAIPKVTMTQVLGKRAREGGDEGGRDKKMPKFEGEFRFQVGGKRKRGGEECPGKKRACLSRALAVPCSRFAASQATNSAVPPPILTPNSIPSNHPPTQAPSTPSAAPPPALEPFQANPRGGLAEAMEFYNDLPTLRREIAWMRAQREIATSRKETRGNTASIREKATKRTATQASYWSKYRENLSR